MNAVDNIERIRDRGVFVSRDGGCLSGVLGVDEVETGGCLGGGTRGRTLVCDDIISAADSSSSAKLYDE